MNSLKYIKAAVIVLLICFACNKVMGQYVEPIHSNSVRIRSSDFGPRNPGNTIDSKLHPAQDYSLGQGQFAYPIKNNMTIHAINITGISNDKYANIELEDGTLVWRYMHVLTEKNKTDRDNLFFQNVFTAKKMSIKVNGVFTNPDAILIREGTVYRLLLPKNVVGSANSVELDNKTYVLNNKIPSTDGITYKLQHTVDITDAVFSPCNFATLPKENYHLDIRISNNLNINPLNYIPYNDSGGPVVNFEFQSIKNNKADANPFSNSNIIYGDVMLQAKVDVTNEPKTGVHANDKKYAEGDADLNHVIMRVYNDITGNAVSINPKYDYMYSGPTITVEKNDVIIQKGIVTPSSPLIKEESEIGQAITPGIYPRPDWVSIDYFKQRWNTDTPLYPDGPYYVSIFAMDVRGNVNNTASQKYPFIVDNYFPYIKTVTIEDENGNIKTFPSNNTLEIGGEQIKVIVQTSEPMYRMLLRGSDMIPDITKQKWYRTIDVPPTCGEEFVLNFNGLDYAGNPLSNSDNYISGSKIIRDNNGTKINMSTVFGDSKYKFLQCPKLTIEGETDFNPTCSNDGNNNELILEAKITGAENCNPSISWTWTGTGETYGANKYKITHQAGEEDKLLIAQLKTSSCTVEKSVKITNGKKAKLDVSIIGDSILYTDCDGQIPSGNSITLTANVSNGGNNLNYNWSTGETTQSIIIKDITSEKKDYSVTITSDACSGKASKTVSKQNPNHLSVSILKEQELTSYCDRIEPCILLAQPRDGILPFNYVWYNESKKNIGEGEKIEVSEEGNYYVIVTDGNSCSSTSSMSNVTLKKEKNLNVKISGDKVTDVKCNGEVIESKTLTASVTGGNEHCLFKWNDGVFSDSPSFKIDKTGTFTVVVRDTLKGCEGVANWKVEPNEINTLRVSISAPSIANLPCNTPIPFPITLTATISGGSGWYATSWDGLDIPFVSTRKIEIFSEGYYAIGVTDMKGGCTAGAGIQISCKTTNCPKDPNEISGNIGYGEPQFVAQTEKLNYTARYENDPDFATAPATRVEITVPISDKQNIRSFRLGDFGFGSFLFTVPQNSTNYYQRLNVADSLGVWVDATAGIDITKNEAFWIFQAIDPQTGIEPTSSQMGFLPVNNKDIGNGEGYVNFSILPATSTQTGDSILAQASVVFDDNAALETNVWSNVIDAGSPQSKLTGVQIPSDSLAAKFTFAAQDDKNGSGVKQVEVYVSENEGAYNLYAVSNPDSTLTFYGASGSVYHFFSIAEDNVGNKEPMKTDAEFTLNLNQPPTDILLSNNSFNENDYYGTIIGSLTTIDDNPQSAYYTLVPGEGDTNNDLFGIYENQLMTNADFNCKSDTVYNVRVRTTDIGGLWFEKTFELKMIKTDVVADTTKIQESICYDGFYDFFGQKLTEAGTYEFAQSCDSVTVLTLSVLPKVTVNLGGNQVVDNYAPLNLNAGDNFKSYEWSTGETTQKVTITNPNKLSDITVWVEVSNEENCIGSDTIQIAYLPTGMNAPNRIIGIFPNPVKQTAKIKYIIGKGTTELRLLIYDVSGRVVDKININAFHIGENEIEWQRKGLASGIYNYSLEGYNEKNIISINRGKFILE